MRRNLVSTKNAGKRESGSITTRGRIKAGIIFHTDEAVAVADLQTALHEVDHELSWDEPDIEETQVFFSVQFPAEELEHASNETVQEYLARLAGIDAQRLDNKLFSIAGKLDKQQLPGVTSITGICDVHSTLT